MRFRIAALVVTLMACLVPLASQSPAQAAGDGCNSPRMKHGQSWAMDRRISAQTIRVTAVVEYIYCPTDLFQNRKIKYNTITYCWTFVGGSQNPAAFDRVDFDPYFFNQGTRVLDPWLLTLDDYGGDLQHCITVSLKTPGVWYLSGNGVDTWWNMTSAPMWRMWATVWRTDGSYDTFPFTYQGNTVRAINPGADPELGGWY
jgi:hypothetical protein